MADSPSSALVRQIEWVATAVLCDPEWCHDMAESEAEIEAWRRGEIEMDTVDIDGLHALFDKLCPGMPMRYRLPKHLHYVGRVSPDAD